MMKMQGRTMLQNTTSRHEIQSSVSIVECYVCGKGLSEGHSISAKTLSNGIVLFVMFIIKCNKSKFKKFFNF